MQHYTVIFLGDDDPPRRIMLLKRAPWKEYAPGLYTGAGGHVEAGETAMQGAVRELEEEAGVVGIPLRPFAGLVCEDGDVIHYFYAVWENAGTVPECPEGELSWSGVDAVEGLDLIPSTRFLLRLWRARGFRTDDPFTILWNETDPDVRPGLPAAQRQAAAAGSS